jgi:hypothetical protein
LGRFPCAVARGIAEGIEPPSHHLLDGTLSTSRHLQNEALGLGQLKKAKAGDPGYVCSAQAKGRSAALAIEGFTVVGLGFPDLTELI